MKYGFKNFASTKHPLTKPAKPPAKEPSSTLGKLLPNGFRVGERIYYVIDNSGRKFWGTVIEHEPGYLEYLDSVDVVSAIFDAYDYGNGNSEPRRFGWLYKEETLRSPS